MTNKKLKRSKCNDIIKRDKWKCRKCGRKTSLEVNHIVPPIDGGTNNSENLATLCQPCHHEWHAYELSSVNCSHNNFIDWLGYPTVFQMIKSFYCPIYQDYKVYEVVNLLQKTKRRGEKDRIRNRTKAALEAVRAKGIKLGRRKVLDEEKTQYLNKLYAATDADGNSKYSIKEICEMTGISKSSIYRYLDK